MTLTQYLRVLRRQWVIVVLLAILGLGGAAAYTFEQVPVYSAQIQLFVSVRNPDTDISGLSQGSTFTQQRVKSYSDLATSPIVALAVINKLNLPYTADQLSGKITATTPLDTVLLNISVSDPDPQRAAAIANAVGSQFPHFIAKLETQTGQVVSPVTVSVTRQAIAPTTPVSPRIPLNLALGLIVGLGLGIGAAVLREQFNTTVSGIGDLERLTGSIPLGVVPFDSGANKQPLVAADQFGGRAEAFRTLRTNLQFADVDDPPRVIAISSPLPAEGKTTTACNVALTLAQSGARVVLVEGDLRKPSVGDYLGISNAAGLTNVLAGQHELRDVIVSYHRDTLAVLPSGPTPPNPSELLGSQQMRQLLATLANHYDMVIIDAPPLLPVTDAAVLAVAADGAILVVRHGRSRREEVERALQALTSVNAKVLGTVLNFAPRKKRAGGYDGYGYGYGYGPTAMPEPQSLQQPKEPQQRREKQSSRRGRAKQRASASSASSTSAPGPAAPVATAAAPAGKQTAQGSADGSRAEAAASLALPPIDRRVDAAPATRRPAGGSPTHQLANLRPPANPFVTPPSTRNTRTGASRTDAPVGIAADPGVNVSVDVTDDRPGQAPADQVERLRLIPPQGDHRTGNGVPRHHRSKRSL